MSSNKVAAIFAGQGSQIVGMGMALARDFQIARSLFQEASDVLGFNLLVAMNSNEVDQTELSQPAILAFGYALFQIARTRIADHWALFAGHSLGEYTALACAGAINFPDAVRLARVRGEAMRDAAPPGSGMVAAVIGLEEPVVAEVCGRLCGPDTWISIANINAPEQIVVSGHRSAVQSATSLFERMGARAVVLPVSVPVHTPLMAPAAQRLSEALETTELRRPAAPWISNLDGEPVSEPQEIRGRLIRQLTAPVRWRDVTKFLFSAQPDRIFEFSARPVLVGLFDAASRERLGARHVGSASNVWQIGSRSSESQPECASPAEFMNRLLVQAISKPCTREPAPDFETNVVRPYRELEQLTEAIERGDAFFEEPVRARALELFNKVLDGKGYSSN